MSETGNFNIIPEALYFDELGVEAGTPGRFNIVWDSINANTSKSIIPAPTCDAFTDLVTYITNGVTASTLPPTVTIADTTAWPTDIAPLVNITFELESGNIGQLGSPSGSNTGAQIDWSIGSYISSLGTDNTETVTVKMTATWNTTTKYAYTTFNLTNPSEKGDPGIDRLIPRIHVADADLPLDGPVSGDAEFIVSDSSMVLPDDDPSRAWKLFHADDLGTELLATAPNNYVGTITGTVGDPDWIGATGSATLRIPIKQAAPYVLELWEKGTLDTAGGDPITTTTAVNDTVNLYVRPYAATRLTYNDGFEPTQPLYVTLTQGISDDTIIHSDYSTNKAFTKSSKIHYLDVSWGYKPNEPDTDRANIVKLSAAGQTALNLIDGEYYLVSLNTGSLKAADYWNTLYLWLDGQFTSGYEIIDTLSSAERTTIDGLYTGFNRSLFDTVVIQTHSNAIIDGDNYTSVLNSSVWQIGPGAEKYKVELIILSPVDNTVQSIWSQAQILSLDSSRPAPIEYRCVGIPAGLRVAAKVTSINGSVATNPQITTPLTVGYESSWVLSAPANLNFTSHTFGVTLSYDEVTDAIGYEIAYGSTPNPTFGGDTVVIRTPHTKVYLPAEVGTTVYVAIRAINAAELAGAIATSSGSVSNVQVGHVNKPEVIGARSMSSGDITRDKRTLSYHSSPAPIRIRSMGIYVHSLTLNGSNTNEQITIYNGNDTSYYSIPVSGEGYFTDEDFPVMDIGQNERIRIAAWNPSGAPATFNDIEFSVDYVYDELDSA